MRFDPRCTIAVTQLAGWIGAWLHMPRSEAKKYIVRVEKTVPPCIHKHIYFNKLGIRRGRGGLPHIYLILPFSLLSLPPGPGPGEEREEKREG